ncbi:hypothetical protein JCM1841_003603 [Sporobolomyces salmonicolor]
MHSTTLFVSLLVLLVAFATPAFDDGLSGLNKFKAGDFGGKVDGFGPKFSLNDAFKNGKDVKHQHYVRKGKDGQGRVEAHIWTYDSDKDKGGKAGQKDFWGFFDGGDG